MKCAIGIDVGGTKTAGGLVLPEGGEVRARRVIPTQPRRGGEAVLAEVLGLARDLLAEAKALALTVLGIGVGVAELVDLEGEVRSAQTIGWRGLPVRESFSRLAPTVVEADVRAAALAEALYGAGRPFRLFLYVTVGTGISASLVQDGRPYTGARGSAGTLASGPTTVSCPGCGAVSRVVLEELASGPALVARWNAARSAAAATAPAGAAIASSGEEVLAAAAAGDPEAIAVVRSAGEALGSAVGLLVNVLDPEAVVVGGGLGSRGGLYFESLAGSIRDHIWSDTHRGLPILRAGRGADAGLIGAAAAVFRKLDLARLEA